jgi:hypothetical protein
MAQPLFSLAYTSVRPECIEKVVRLWRGTALHKQAVEIVVAVDGNRLDCIAAARKISGIRVVIQTEPPFNCVRGWNRAAEETTGKVLIAVSDDFKPCQNWDKQLMELRRGWMDEDWVVHTEDGYVHDIIVLPIITRIRYKRFGYFFYPQYESLFSDTELTEVAKTEGLVLNAMHILMEHMHPDCSKRPRDHHDDVHASKARWDSGEVLFKIRRRRGFPVDDGPKAVVGKSGNVFPAYAAYIQANRDDFCLNEVVDRLFDEGIRNFFFCIPDEYWSGLPTPQGYIDEVIAASDRIRKFGATSQAKIFCVGVYRNRGDSRVTVETRVRNDSLTWVRQHGFHQICVVDSDELWQVGTLAHLNNIVTRIRPCAISLPMTPVVGLPGYPIDGARDRVISYVGRHCTFRDCRSPADPVHNENTAPVIHFTGTRRTLEDTIQKHRESGHFDDPIYRFEEWIEKVLPNIKPGFRHQWPNGQEGVHMWIGGPNIWPVVRNWTRAELQQLPPTLLPYLAAGS